MVHHCTRCDLRFRSAAELREHLTVDHNADPSVLDPYRYAASRAQDPLYADLRTGEEGKRRLLVVANRTLLEPALLDAVAARLADGPVEAVIVVPATHSADYEPPAGEGVTPHSDEPGTARASWRLRQAVEDLAQRGVDASAHLGPPDPYEAAGQELEGGGFDEVLLSTLPPALSRWFGTDVAARLRRRFDVPVTVLSTEPASTGQG